MSIAADDGFGSARQAKKVNILNSAAAVPRKSTVALLLSMLFYQQCGGRYSEPAPFVSQSFINLGNNSEFSGHGDRAHVILLSFHFDDAVVRHGFQCPR